MKSKGFKRVFRPASAEERNRHAEIRRKVMGEFPPSPGAGRRKSPPGIPTAIRRARQAKGLTWYALAKLAGIPNSNTVRDIEYGRDAQLSSVQAVAKALGLRIELVAEDSRAS
jgi:ribosome-binding protein aMBF1 (putative translation factor)